MSSQLVSDSVMFDPRSYGEYPSSESAASLPLSFNVRSQHVFLTYPRCPIPPKDAGSFLKKLCKRYNIQYMYIAQELHQDGEPHLHAFLQFDKVFRTTSAKYFDFFEFHPNIQAARNPEKTLEYCQKNPADFYEDGVFVKPKASRKRKLASFTRDKKMKQIMANATSRDEYLSMIRKAFPFDWAIRLQQFEYSAKALFPEAPIQYQPQFVSNDMSDHPVIGEWLDTEFFTQERGPHHRRRSLYICGPTRTGKTSWARSLGTHHYWQHSVDFLTEWNKNAIYNVIDDIPFKFVPCWKGLVGSQFDITVNPKYGKKKTIPNGIPSIILANEDEDWLQTMSPQQADWFHGNCVVYYLQAGESFIPPSSDVEA
ncbi:replication associated protein [Digitaria didactyla striate mosaic virus]|uniref:Replication-associated protein n=1 Tax=Digitaria didactyla striate mosaic virus TaxID=889510 RepID=E2FER3_9GEMI|nr:replication associated protein [Digitaria didactyla striate mosaic virus]ADN93260.1 replication associated protein [Digitaria didactyla striate mosaic virus]